MEGNGSSRTKALLVILVVFIMGFAAGALSLNLYRTAWRGGGGFWGREGALRKFDQRLNLAPEQHGRVEEILRETFDQYDEIKNDIGPRYEAVRQQSRERIRAVLNPEQIAEYEKMIEEADKKRERWKEKEGRREKR
jgi:hypothetical protein